MNNYELRMKKQNEKLKCKNQNDNEKCKRLENNRHCEDPEYSGDVAIPLSSGYGWLVITYLKVVGPSAPLRILRVFTFTNHSE
jgi:hypothetical protein